VLKLGHFDSRTQITAKFLNVVLEKNGDQLDGSYETLKSVTKCQGGKKHPTHNIQGTQAGFVTSCVATAF
jgi:hypothetical protein